MTVIERRRSSLDTQGGQRLRLVRDIPPSALGTDGALSSESGHDEGKYDHRLKN
jgi:hypothetical protein